MSKKQAAILAEISEKLRRQFGEEKMIRIICNDLDYENR